MALLWQDLEDEIRQVIITSGLPDIGIYIPDPGNGGQGGWDCDDYAVALGWHLHRHFGPNLPAGGVKEIAAVLIQWNNGIPSIPVHESHWAVKVTATDGTVIFCDPQTGNTGSTAVDILPGLEGWNTDGGVLNSEVDSVKVLATIPDARDIHSENPREPYPARIHTVNFFNRLREMNAPCPYCGGDPSQPGHDEGQTGGGQSGGTGGGSTSGG